MRVPYTPPATNQAEYLKLKVQIKKQQKLLEIPVEKKPAGRILEMVRVAAFFSGARLCQQDQSQQPQRGDISVVVRWN